jgi:capsular polysaccharide transport system permease protein
MADDEDIKGAAEPSGPARSLLGRADAKGLVGRLKSSMPALFTPPPAADLPEQLQLLLAMRAHRLRRFVIRSLVFVVLPCLLVLIYTALIATQRYVCSFQVTYQIYQPATSMASGLVPTTQSSSDSIDYGTVIDEYVSSQALADKLDQQLHLRAYYSSQTIDWTSRLNRNATEEEYYKYFCSRVSVSEGFGGYLSISVQAFDPKFALKMAQTINGDANSMLDGITGQARAAQVKAASDEVAQTAEDLQMASAALTNFRNVHGDLDPSQIATELGTIEGTLESQLASVKAQLAQAQANLQPNASQILQLNLQVAAIQHEIDAERDRLASGGGQTNYSGIVTQYQTLLSEQQMAMNNYQAAQSALMTAKTDAAREQYYVVDFVAPTLPDRPTAPDPLISTGETFLACIVLYSIVNLLFSALRDQTGV